ncbi:hypothetical protein C8J29_107106 [Cereibacter johrii]|uniref:Uncharacterized protein n=1 Tax=Cereibacter johrii TaxID=445629 RepID=A0ABX5J4V1_9RHOB|nr:hypothetical protein C8J29_107106 [Cereibacter johrii]
MLVLGRIPADGVERQAQRRDLGTEERMFIGRHHPGRRNAAHRQKQDGKQHGHDMSRKRTHDCLIHQWFIL